MLVNVVCRNIIVTRSLRLLVRCVKLVHWVYVSSLALLSTRFCSFENFDVFNSPNRGLQFTESRSSEGVWGTFFFCVFVSSRTVVATLATAWPLFRPLICEPLLLPITNVFCLPAGLPPYQHYGHSQLILPSTSDRLAWAQSTSRTPTLLPSFIARIYFNLHNYSF